MIAFDQALSALHQHQVRFLIAGGAAAVAHGSARLTHSLDIVYERSPANLECLAAALSAHNPYLRGAPSGLPFLWGTETLKRGLNFTLTTNFGDVDLFGEIPGGGSYDDLAGGTVQLDLFGIRCRCLSFSQLIRAKRAAGRPKDLEALAELEAIAEET